MGASLATLQKRIAKAERERISRDVTAAAEATPAEWSDFEYFAGLTRARTSEGVRGLQLYQWQREFTELADRRDAVLTKSRQVGASQWLIAYCLQKALINPGYGVVIFSKGYQEASDLARRMRRAIAGIEHPCAKPQTDSLSIVQLPNDSEIKFRSASPPEKAGRSIDGVNLLIFDEASWCLDLAQNLGNMQSTLAQSNAPRLLLLSTPNGRSGAYWEKLIEGIGEAELERVLQGMRDRTAPAQQAIEPPTGFAKYITHWSSIPKLRDEPDFPGRMQAAMPLDKWKREFELDFSEADSAVFPRELIAAAEVEAWQPQEPENWGVYLHGCDPSGSTGRDNFVSVVLKLCPNGQLQVADLYQRNSGSFEGHCQAVIEQIRRFNPVSSSIELNSMGGVILEQVAAALPGQEIEGCYVTQAKKSLLIGRVLMSLEMGLLKVPKAIAEEMRVFVRKPGGALEAGPGPINDDGISAIAQALTGWNPQRKTKTSLTSEF